jgi:hypothetical protein
LDENQKLLHFKEDYFTKKPDGSAVNFNSDCYLPFIQSYMQAIKKAKSSFLLFFEPIPGTDPPFWKEEERTGLVYAPHWYDLKAIFSKVFFFIFYIKILLIKSSLLMVS